MHQINKHHYHPEPKTPKLLMRGPHGLVHLYALNSLYLYLVLCTRYVGFERHKNMLAFLRL